MRINARINDFWATVIFMCKELLLCEVLVHARHVFFLKITCMSSMAPTTIYRIPLVNMDINIVNFLN